MLKRKTGSVAQRQTAKNTAQPIFRTVFFARDKIGTGCHIHAMSTNFQFSFLISEDWILTTLAAFLTSQEGLLTSLAAFLTSED